MGDVRAHLTKVRQEGAGASSLKVTDQLSTINHLIVVQLALCKDFHCPCSQRPQPRTIEALGTKESKSMC